ncbi:MAG: MBL fold metallo-hydrolase [Oscillospiraceae bacterium]|jgi:phosphoribosyl 1,2-cyclic phosphodiesterase
MAEFFTIASSSSGNCSLLSDGGTHILIDAGISLRRIKSALSERCLELSDLSGVLITHEHSDHIAGLRMLQKYYGIPVYASRGTGGALLSMLPEIRNNLILFGEGDAFYLGEVYIKAFKTPHDTAGSVGFRFELSGGHSMGFATDLGCVTPEVMGGVRGARLIVLEANHDLEMLRIGHYPPYLKRRIRGENGHLSNTDCGSAAAQLVKSGTETLILAHLSKENNTPELAQLTVADAVTSAGAVPGRDLCLDVAPRCEIGRVYKL